MAHAHASASTPIPPPTHLVLDVHLVKLVDAADAVVRQHQRARLDAKLVALAFLQGSKQGEGGKRGEAKGRQVSISG
jgi:hypothetical protein